VAVKISYGAGPTTFTLLRAPINFTPYWDVRCHDNLSTDGSARERVVENPDILIAFEAPHMVLFDDLQAWALFQQFALLGGSFKVYPWAAFSDYYNCVAEDTGWRPQRNALRKYGTNVVWRILQDGQTPATPEIVLRRFHGVTP